MYLIREDGSLRNLLAHGLHDFAANSMCTCQEKRLFMSESISKIRSGNAPPVPEAGGLPGAADAEARQERLDNAAMKKMADEILKLGTSTMEAKARRRFQVSQLIRAGAIAPKSAFVPKDILKGMRAKSKVIV